MTFGVLTADLLGGVAFRRPWPHAVMLGLAVRAVAVAIFLYVRSRGVARWKRVLLGGLRAAALLLLLLVLFEPVAARSRSAVVPANVLVLIDVSASMAHPDDRRSPADVEEAARALNLAGSARAVPATPRLILAKAILRHPDLGYLRDAGPTLRLRYCSFGDRLEPLPDDPAARAEAVGKLKTDAPATRLGDSLAQAVERQGGEPVAAVIVLTDGIGNEGAEALDVARGLSAPVYPVAIGLARPEDVRVVTATVPETVFPKDRVGVRVQLASTPALAGREVLLTATDAAGRELDRKPVRLTGAAQFEELGFVPDQGGTLQIDIAVSPLPEEVVAENNRVRRAVRVADEKIRVLFVEGRPRWEFRYLRAVLERDHRLAVKFPLVEGDPDLANASPQYVAKFPEGEAAAFRYDLVVLGDVPADRLTPAQLGWLERLVRERGGSFLMLAGQRFAPATYGDTPVAKLLPVRLGAPGRELVRNTVVPVVTAGGQLSRIMALEPDDAANAAAWALVTPMYDVPRLAGAKPGATVLATLSDRAADPDPYPLVAWHRYGTGKTMFVGTDALWRLRFKRGDEYHARFWGQAIQFLALSRVLGENKRVRVETERTSYRTGERVPVQATVLDPDYKPVKADGYTVLVDRVPPRGEPVPLVLKPVPGEDGLFQGSVAADEGGVFRVAAPPADEGHANRVEYTVESVDRERLDLDVRRDALEKLAGVTGGKLLTVGDLPGLAETFPDRSRKVALPAEETRLLDPWAVLAVLVFLTGAEWFLRRRNDPA